MVTHCAVKSDNFTFDIVGPEETDVVTVGNLGVKGAIFFVFEDTTYKYIIFMHNLLVYSEK